MCRLEEFIAKHKRGITSSCKSSNATFSMQKDITTTLVAAFVDHITGGAEVTFTKTLERLDAPGAITNVMQKGGQCDDQTCGEGGEGGEGGAGEEDGGGEEGGEGGNPQGGEEEGGGGEYAMNMMMRYGTS